MQDVPLNTEDLVAVFSDGFQVSYHAVWKMSEPEKDTLLKTHGTKPVYYHAKDLQGTP